MRLAMLLLLAAGSPLQAEPTRSLTIFSPQQKAEGKTAWQPGPGAPAARVDNGNPGGIRFACPFQGDLGRVFWDQPASLDLSGAALLELDLSCGQPEAIRSVGLYFKSGAGWYLWLPRLKEAGRQKLYLALGDAAQEGQPAGWDAISGVRISFTRGASANAEVLVHDLRIRSCAVLVVRAVESVPNSDEGNAARSAAVRWGSWLDSLGIPYAVLDDSRLNSSALQAARIAVLPYNPMPSRQELRALGSFVKRNGKLIVCYSSEPRLAELMGLTLGNYQAAARPGQWSSFAFNRPALPYAPAVIYQDSSNIRPALPADDSSRVIATWRDSSGKALADPAWVQSPQGFWMSHILADGDEANKQRLIAALLGFLDAAIWKDVAERMWVQSGKVASFQSLADSLAGIRRLDDSQRAEPLLARVKTLDDQMRAEVGQKKFAAAADTGWKLNAALVRAYAAVQHPRTPEFRGVWNHSGTGLYPGDWNATCRALADAGLTAVFPNLAWAGTAHYPSRYAPLSFTARTYGDQLKQSAAAARRYGLELHVWKICWNLGQAPDDQVQRLRQAGRLQQTDEGKSLEWLCPTHPANVAQELNMLAEILERAEVNGIHLDYLRYPNSHACFCAGCQQRFEKYLGRPIRNWPAGVQAGELKSAFTAWRAARMTDFVRAAHDLLSQRKSKAKLSAAVYPNYPACAEGLGQDWGSWLKEGLVDFVCPMDYAEDIANFSLMAQRQLSLPNARNRVFPGLGVTAAESRLTADKVIEQILRVRQAGAGGFMLFELNATLEKDILPALSLGVTRGEH